MPVEIVEERTPQKQSKEPEKNNILCENLPAKDEYSNHAKSLPGLVLSPMYISGVETDFSEIPIEENPDHLLDLLPVSLPFFSSYNYVQSTHSP